MVEIVMGVTGIILYIIELEMLPLLEKIILFINLFMISLNLKIHKYIIIK